MTEQVDQRCFNSISDHIGMTSYTHRGYRYLQNVASVPWKASIQEFDFSNNSYSQYWKCNTQWNLCMYHLKFVQRDVLLQIRLNCTRERAQHPNSHSESSFQRDTTTPYNSIFLNLSWASLKPMDKASYHPHAILRYAYYNHLSP